MTISPPHQLGRALIGWMSVDDGALALAGRQASGKQDAALRERVEAARSAVASRRANVEQSHVIDDTPAELQVIRARLQGQADAAPFWADGWSLAVVDLTRVGSLQQSIAAQLADVRVESVDPSSLVAIAEITLPAPTASALPVQLDSARNQWIISAANPNLRISGHFQGEVQPGVHGFGFTVGVAQSFMQVARHHGRLVLRDGYHRAYGFLKRGITRVPAFVRDFGMGALGVSPGLFGTEVYLGPRPPVLSDFQDDAVAADIELPVVQKMVVVQGLELIPVV